MSYAFSFAAGLGSVIVGWGDGSGMVLIGGMCLGATAVRAVDEWRGYDRVQRLTNPENDT